MNVLTPIVPYHFHDQAGFGKPVIKKKKKGVNHFEILKTGFTYSISARV